MLCFGRRAKGIVTHVFMPQAELGLDNDVRHSNKEFNDNRCVDQSVVVHCVEPEVCYEVGEEGEEVV